jgi:hypothetical protein
LQQKLYRNVQSGNDVGVSIEDNIQTKRVVAQLERSTANGAPLQTDAIYDAGLSVDQIPNTSTSSATSSGLRTRGAPQGHFLSLACGISPNIH